MDVLSWRSDRFPSIISPFPFSFFRLSSSLLVLFIFSRLHLLVVPFHDVVHSFFFHSFLREPRLCSPLYLLDPSTIDRVLRYVHHVFYFACLIVFLPLVVNILKNTIIFEHAQMSMIADFSSLLNLLVGVILLSSPG